MVPIRETQEGFFFPRWTSPVRFAWSKVISRGGCFDGLSDLDEIFPSVKTDLNSDRRISPSSVGKYVLGNELFEEGFE